MEEITEKELTEQEYSSEINETVDDFMQLVVNEQKKIITKRHEHSEKEHNLLKSK